MSRFQAVTSPLLDQELSWLGQEMGLRESQKAELLRELGAITAWVLRQARLGRTIEARGPDGVEVLHHPALEAVDEVSIRLSPAEAERLLSILDSPPPPALQETLRRISDPDRKPPRVVWRTKA